jgi:hypothetical protein
MVEILRSVPYAAVVGPNRRDRKQPQTPPAADIVQRDGLRAFAPATAMVRVPEIFFAANSTEIQAVLAGFRDAAELLRRLLDGGHSARGGQARGCAPAHRVGGIRQRDRHDD